MKKYALIGEKLGHSHSPLVHSKIFKDFGVDATYEKIECSKDELENVINNLKNGIYMGYNVTIPYKLEVMKYLDEIDIHAKKIGAVNTVANINGKAVGFNSDYYGFKDEVLHYNIDCKDKDCYILGTGGASKAVYHALNDLGGNVYFVSRNPKDNITITYDELKKRDIFLLVNATPLGMSPNVDSCAVSEEICKKAKYAMDLIFNPRQTKFLKYAGSTMDGLYMLVSQAVKSEEIWQDREYPGDINSLVKEIEGEI